MKHKLIFLVCFGIIIFIAFFIFGCYQIGQDIKKQCQIATQEYEADCVESLIKQLNDSEKSFRKRNSAIWALGQLGDSRALPFLEKYFNNDIPSKEPLDQKLSQYELKKAINLVSGGFNVTAIFWRSDRNLF